MGGKFNTASVTERLGRGQDEGEAALGPTVIDVGVNRIDDPVAQGSTRLVGDVDFANVQPIAGKITPNPGGVGPMTIAMLMANTVRAARLATA